MKRKRNQSRPTPSALPEEPLFIGRHPDLPDELFDQFMQSVHAFESAPTTTLSRLLISDGMHRIPGIVKTITCLSVSFQ